VLVRLALRSRTAAATLVADPDLLAPAGFHAQQFVLHTIKAVLVSNGVVFRPKLQLGAAAGLLASCSLGPPLGEGPMALLDQLALAQTDALMIAPAVSEAFIRRCLAATTAWLFARLAVSPNSEDC
jgi:hypothetical protein